MMHLGGGAVRCGAGRELWWRKSGVGELVRGWSDVATYKMSKEAAQVLPMRRLYYSVSGMLL